MTCSVWIPLDAFQAVRTNGEDLLEGEQDRERQMIGPRNGGKAMGQALRVAAGRVRASKVQPQLAQHLKNAERRSPQGPAAETPYAPTAGQDGVGAVSDAGGLTRGRNDPDVLEERDATYDAMLSKMVGRITSKPGGKLEMGEAFIVERYNRPMPKLRSSKAAAEGGAGKPPPSGTLEAAQLREILLLREGKSDEYPGPMPVEAIADRFGVDVAQLQSILRFVSLPPEDKVNDKSEQSQN